MIIEQKNRVAGFYSLQVLDKEGNVIEERSMPNLILNQGLDRLGSTGNVMIYCRVGTGNSAPVATQSQLDTEVAYTSSATNESGTNGASPWYLYYRRAWTFPVGFVATPTNIAEVAVGWGTAVTDIYSRALILDGVGNPTTLSVDSTNSLRVVYEHRVYPTEADNVQTVADSGTSVSHTLTTRPSFINTVTVWTPTSSGVPAANDCRASDGTIGTITGDISGSVANASSVTAGSYTNGTYYLDFTIKWDAGVANFAGGISAIRFLSRSVYGCYQTGISPAIAKDNTQFTEITYRVSWARATI